MATPDVISNSFSTDADGNQLDPQGNVLARADIDPFFDSANPAGADGIWFTADDGLRLNSTTRLLDRGIDRVTGFSIPQLDLAGAVRPAASSSDPGAYEGGFVQP